MHFINICVKNQQMQQLFIHFIIMDGISYMFRHYIAILSERSQCLLRDAELRRSRFIFVVGRVVSSDVLHENHVTRHNCTQLTPKTASVVPPEDGRLTPETCGGLRHNKVIVKVKVY
jgi:hypothetical protein